MTDRDTELEALRKRVAELEKRGGAPADSAPGGPPSRRPGRPWPVLGVIALLGVPAGLVLWFNASPATAPPAAPPAAPGTAAVDAPLVTSIGWVYDVLTDPMVDKRGHSACVRSDDQVQLQPPYSPVGAHLCISQRPKGQVYVLLTLDGDGQILCRSYETCSVHLRLDNGPMRTISGIGPSDGSTNAVFLLGTGKLIPQIKASSVTRIELEYYQAGQQALTFKTAGLEWPVTRLGG